MRSGGGADPPPSDNMGYGQQADSTHPTGMHSCIMKCVKGYFVNTFLQF